MNGIADSASLILAFVSGIASFFTPCILPLIPVYLSFITGISVDELQKSSATEGPGKDLKKVFIETFLFVLGFSFVFISLGASATYFSNLLFQNRRLIKILGGIIVIVFGLQIAGVFNIKYLQFEKKIHLKSRPAGRIGSFIIGAVFAIGWTPCVGPILASILALAGTKETVGQGIMLLSFYSLGLAIPFLLASIFIGWMLGTFTKIKKYLRIISIAAGILLVVFGAGIATGFIHF